MPTPPPAGAALPQAFRTEWLATGGVFEGIGYTDDRIRLLVDEDGGAIRLALRDGPVTLNSLSVPATTGEVRLVSERTGGGCEVDDAGAYAWSLSSDGSELTLTAIEDDCPNRAEVLDQIWSRAVDGVSRGGRGVVAAFDPMLRVTIPEGPFVTARAVGSADVISTELDRRLTLVRDPWALEDPCAPMPTHADEGAGIASAKVAILPQTVDAFVEHLRALPGHTVEATERTIDGRRAVHAAVSTVRTDDCPGGKVYEMVARSFESNLTWSVVQGESKDWYVIEVDRHVIVASWDGAGVTDDEAFGVLSTIEFFDALPDAR